MNYFLLAFEILPLTPPFLVLFQNLAPFLSEVHEANTNLGIAFNTLE